MKDERRCCWYDVKDRRSCRNVKFFDLGHGYGYCRRHTQQRVEEIEMAKPAFVEYVRMREALAR